MAEFEITPNVEKWIRERRGRLHAYENIDAVKTALLVVDMQDYFLDEASPACCAPAQDIIPNINLLSHTLREAGGLVVWIKTEAGDEVRTDWANLCELYTPEINEKRFEMLDANSPYFQLTDELDISPKDETVIKTRYSAFIQGSSDIEARLRSRHIDTVLVTGTVTNVCCDSTARDAMMRGFRAVMVSDANAAFSQDEHNAALNTFLRVFGDVQSTDQLVERISDQLEAPAVGAAE